MFSEMDPHQIASLTTVLANTLNPSKDVRTTAESQLVEARKSNPILLMKGLLFIATDGGSQNQANHSACVNMRRMLKQDTVDAIPDGQQQQTSQQAQQQTRLWHQLTQQSNSSSSSEALNANGNDFQTQFCNQLILAFERVENESIAKGLAGVIAVVCELRENNNSDSNNLNSNSSESDAENDNVTYTESPPAWPELMSSIVRIYSTGGSSDNIKKKLACLSLIQELSQTDVTVILNSVNKSCLAQILMHSLQNDSPPELQTKGCGLILMIVSEMSQLESDRDKQLGYSNWSEVQSSFLSQLVDLFKKNAEIDSMKYLSDYLSEFSKCCDTAADFLKPRYLELAELFLAIADNKNVEDDDRALSFENFLTLCEKKPKYIANQSKKSLAAGPGPISSDTPIPIAKKALEVSIRLLIEIEEDEDWLTIDEDQEVAAEDSEGQYALGLDAVDRLTRCFGYESCGDLEGLVNQCIIQQGGGNWKIRHAGFALIRQSIEYIQDDNLVDRFAELCLKFGPSDSHPRVRALAWKSLCQLSDDQSPHFQERSYKQVFPILLSSLKNEKENRVLHTLLHCFIEFSEPCETVLLSESNLAQQFMELFVPLLGNAGSNSNQHQGILQQSLTAISVISVVLGEDFKTFYTPVVNQIRSFLDQSSSSNSSNMSSQSPVLRGKAYECIANMSKAVGKDVCLNDALWLLRVMMTRMNQQNQNQNTSSQQELDPREQQHILHSTEIIASVLKKDFLPFLADVLPPLLAKLKWKKEIDENALVEEINKEERKKAQKQQNGGIGTSGTGGDSDDDDDDDDDDDAEVIYFEAADGRQVHLKTSRLEEMRDTLENVQNLIESALDYDETVNMSSASVTAIPHQNQATLSPELSQSLADILLPIMEDASIFSFERQLLTSAYTCWAHLVRASNANGSGPNATTKSLVEIFLQKVTLEADDLSCLSAKACGLSAVLRSLKGTNLLGQNEVSSLSTTIMTILPECIKYKNKVGGVKSSKKGSSNKNLSNENGPSSSPNSTDDEDEDFDALLDDDDEESELAGNCFALQSLMGTLMEICPNEFINLGLLQKTSMACEGLWKGQRGSSKMNKVEDKSIAASFAQDLVEHLKEQSVSSFPVFFPKFLDGLHDKDETLRYSVAMLVSYSARLGDGVFGVYAEGCVGKLAHLLLGRKRFMSMKTRRPSESELLALDAVIAAFFDVLTNCYPTLSNSQTLSQSDLEQSFDLCLDSLQKLKTDEDEINRIFTKLIEMFIQSQQDDNQAHPLLKGSVSRKAKCIAALIETYNLNVEAVTNVQLNKKIELVLTEVKQQLVSSGQTANSFLSSKQVAKLGRVNVTLQGA